MFLYAKVGRFFICLWSTKVFLTPTAVTLIILEIQKTGLGGGASDDPNDVTYVADDALSGFGGDYDYSDYYDDYETTEIEAKDISGDQSKIRQEEITIPERKVTLTLFHIY